MHELISLVSTDGQHHPTIDELQDKFSTMNPISLLQNTRSITDQDGPSLSFDTTEHSRLFALYLAAQGYSNQLFSPGLSDNIFETDKPLNDYRLDGVWLSLHETISGGRTQLKIVFKQINPEYRTKYSNLINQTIAQITPHLSGSTKYI